MTLQEIINTLTGLISGLLLALLALRWFAQKIIEAKIDALKQKEVETLKASLNQQLEEFKANATKELESVKHALQLEYAKLAIVYETQKAAFETAIKAINDGIRAIEERWDNNDETFRPVDGRSVEVYWRTIEGQGLFIAADGNRILHLFGEVMRDAVADASSEVSPDGRTIRNVMETLVYLKTVIVAYFQKMVGLPASDAPLLGAYYLARAGPSVVFIAQNETGQHQLVYDWTHAALPPNRLTWPARTTTY